MLGNGFNPTAPQLNSEKTDPAPHQSLPSREICRPWHHTNTTASGSLDVTTRTACSLISSYSRSSELFWGALKYMPTCGSNQIPTGKARKGKAAHCVNLLTPGVKVKEVVDRDQDHLPNAGNHRRRAQRCLFNRDSGQQRPSPPVPHTPLKLS